MKRRTDERNELLRLEPAFRVYLEEGGAPNKYAVAKALDCSWEIAGKLLQGMIAGAKARERSEGVRP
jgi:hypothetical protein